MVSGWSVTSFRRLVNFRHNMTDPVSDLITDSMIPRGPVQWAAQTYRIQQGTMKYIEYIMIMPNKEKGRGPWRETTEQWFLTWMLYSLLAWAETLGRTRGSVVWLAPRCARKAWSCCCRRRTASSSDGGEVIWAMSERKRFFFWDVFPNCSITELKKRAKRSITANSLHLLICFLVSLYLSKYK